MRKKWMAFAIILSVVGLITAFFSLSEYLHIQKAGLEVPSFCAIDETINCDIVNASSYAVMFGLPTAAWGIIFYVLVLVFLFYIRLSKKDREIAASFIFWTAVVGFLWSVRMGLVSYFVLHAICLTCGAQYIVNALLLLTLYFSFKLSLADRFKKLFSGKIFGPALSALIIMGIGYIFASSALKNKEAELSPSEIEDAVSAFYRQSLYSMKPEDIEGAPYWGNKSAKVVIIEFSDYQCPFCRIAAFNIKPYLYEFKDKVKLVFVNYPLDNACNKYMQSPMHPSSCVAAKAAICAGEKEKFWDVHNAIFRNQRNLNYESITNIASSYGIDKDWLVSCMESPAVKERLEKDIELSHRIYLTGTPSVFIDNRILRFWRSPEVLRAIIREEIKKNY